MQFRPRQVFHLIAFALGLLFTAAPLAAQTAGPLTFATVDRPPFSMPDGVGRTGFSIELMQAVARNLGRELNFRQFDTFPEMFEAMTRGQVDGAIANISITSAREQVMDFSQPIFESGLQIMVPPDDAGSSLLSALFSWDILIALIAAFVLLFGGGMAMWAFERRRQPYFDRPAREALFPSFWWALNLVVNGGFEERVPQSRPGRVFAVLLVVSSLFIVSIFVARITAAMTIQAIAGNINSLNDLETRHVATTRGSTASIYLSDRDIAHTRTDRLEDLFAGFEEGTFDAVVFDGPILAWYIQTRGAGRARLVQRVFKPENYGIALPTGSLLTEDINRSLLSLRESGTHARIRGKWFGAAQ